ncbi:hypothetical protein SAMN02745857_03601 [Andreprevotia lacus DSM 23236]|jgi:hypothetical protein|uniref:Uncharacterized protein n=1 Tax=Andreprevotia lacus DSM 23236 TaxID=1121001 RepID=A0A1W1XYR0_9NEIS|nr:hypothetical protein [Andreprevotia lacus]SMC29099.1 hypothetical protein SAMN02745857_03601 [Andreprevotia lacus DSM 23236]
MITVQCKRAPGVLMEAVLPGGNGRGNGLVITRVDAIALSGVAQAVTRPLISGSTATGTRGQPLQYPHFANRKWHISDKAMLNHGRCSAEGKARTTKHPELM